MSHVHRRGSKWQATYRGPDHRERTKTFARKRDAEDWLAQHTADMRTGAWIDPRAGKIQFQTYADIWLAGRVELRTTTQAKYRFLLDHHISPSLGATPLGTLTTQQIRDWYFPLRNRHPSTGASAYRLLAVICKAAVREKIIAFSPCDIAGAATEHAEERPVLSVPELEKAVEATSLHFRLAVLLAIRCQLRRGEVLGLQRGDINLLHRRLSVRRTWALRADGMAVLGPPKTEAGRRTIAIPGNLIPEVEDHLIRSTAPEPDAWLFPGTAGDPVSPRTLDHAWAKARAAIGRKDVRFHDLRHSGLTLAASTGAALPDLMHRAGHRSPAASLRYLHAAQERDHKIADALADLATSQLSEGAAQHLAYFPRTWTGPHTASAPPPPPSEAPA